MKAEREREYKPSPRKSRDQSSKSKHSSSFSRHEQPHNIIHNEGANSVTWKLQLKDPRAQLRVACDDEKGYKAWLLCYFVVQLAYFSVYLVVIIFSPGCVLLMGGFNLCVAVLAWIVTILCVVYTCHIFPELFRVLRANFSLAFLASHDLILLGRCIGFVWFAVLSEKNSEIKQHILNWEYISFFGYAFFSETVFMVLLRIPFFVGARTYALVLLTVLVLCCLQTRFPSSLEIVTLGCGLMSWALFYCNRKMVLFDYALQSLHDRLEISTLHMRMEPHRQSVVSELEHTKAKTLVFGQLAHDIGSPLAALSMATELIEQQVNENESLLVEGVDQEHWMEQREACNAMHAAIAAITVLRQSMLDYVKKANGVLLKPSIELIDLNRLVIRKAFSMLRQLLKDKPDVVPSWKIDARLLEMEIYSCESWLLDVLLNYISNAVKFTKIGMIEVRARLVEVSTSQDAEMVLEVQDSGCGIPNEKMEQLFMAFNQLQETMGGTGLGLCSVKQKALLLGGKASFFNNADQSGSTFYFSVPLSKKVSNIPAQDGLSQQISPASTLNVHTLLSPRKIHCNRDFTKESPRYINSRKSTPRKGILKSTPRLQENTFNDGAFKPETPVASHRRARDMRSYSSRRGYGGASISFKSQQREEFSSFYSGARREGSGLLRSPASSAKQREEFSFYSVSRREGSGLLRSTVSSAKKAWGELSGSSSSGSSKQSTPSFPQSQTKQTGGALRPTMQISTRGEQYTTQTCPMPDSSKAAPLEAQDLSSDFQDTWATAPNKMTLPLPSNFSNNISVMVVDDSPVLLNLYTRLLKKLGVQEVIQAESGEKCLEMLFGPDSCGLQVDVIIMDDNMPGRRGPDVAREIAREMRENGKIFPDIFICTGTPIDLLMRDFPDINEYVSEILLKPVTFSSLKGILQYAAPATYVRPLQSGVELSQSFGGSTLGSVFGLDLAALKAAQQEMLKVQSTDIEDILSSPSLSPVHNGKSSMIGHVRTYLDSSRQHLSSQGRNSEEDFTKDENLIGKSSV